MLGVWVAVWFGRVRQGRGGALGVLLVAATAGMGSLVLAAPAGAENYALIAQFGNGGSGDGQFNSPEGVAVSAGGEIFVADAQNHRIQVFTSAGVYDRQWGGNGTGDGQFAIPQGVAIAPSGDVVVADTDNDRIQVFESDGDFIRKWSGSTTGGPLNRPEKVAVDAAGNVYVAERDGHQIQVFEPDGDFIRKWGSQGTADGQFSAAPRGIALDSAIPPNVYVADDYRVQVFNNSGGFVRKWGSSGSGNGQFGGLRGIAVNSAGHVFVADEGNARVQEFDSIAATIPAAFVRKWASTGRAVAFAATGEPPARRDVYVAESESNRIGKYTLGPEITVNNVLVPASDPGRFDLRVNGATVAPGAGSGGQGSAGVLPNSNATVSEVAATGTSLADYTTSIDCGAGPQAATSLALTNVSADITCTITNTRRPTVTVQQITAPLADPGRFDLKVNDTTVKAGASATSPRGSTTVVRGSNVTVSEAAAAGTNLADYDVQIDCGAGPQTGTSITLTNVTADTTCTITNTRRGAPPVKIAQFSFTGAEQQFTVPEGVTSVYVVAVGGQGGDDGNVQGGRGAVAVGNVAVTPGQILFVAVGGNGSPHLADYSVHDGGFNGGGKSIRGSGGGASDIRTISRANADVTASLDSRLFTAGGGGGAGGSGAGGEAGAGGASCMIGGTTASGGGPGTSSGGGAAGGTFPGGYFGEPGTFGLGGSTGKGVGFEGGGPPGGGGGGGGWYGGGSGGGASIFVDPSTLGCGSGGGGGSSFPLANASSVAVAERGAPSGVTIEYAVPGAPDPEPSPTPTATATPAPIATATPTPTPPAKQLNANELILSCEKTRIVLVDVVLTGRRVRITGVAAAAFNGKKLDVLLNNKKVGSVTVAAGEFDDSFKPPKARDVRRARYQVRLGSEKSRRIKLDRRVFVDQIAVRGSQVVIEGRVRPPLARRPDKIVFQRQTSCTEYVPVGSATPNRRGRFTARFPLPPAPIEAAVYRGETRVAGRAGGKPTVRSFTLARAINVR